MFFLLIYACFVCISLNDLIINYEHQINKTGGFIKMLQEAFLAGIWASVGSCLGKLSGTPAIVGDNYVILGVLLLLMVLANTWGCRHYLRSLDAATNSVAPTIISATSTYVLSGVIGVLVFEEAASWRWWAGAALITAGLTLVARPRNTHKHVE